MKSETPREIAERIVRETILVVPGKIADKYVNAIEAALDAERERAAKIAEAEAQQATRDEAISNDDADRGHCYAAMKIAAAIRGKD